MFENGAYLYGFTDATFHPADDLRGLRDAPVSVLAYGGVAALVSPHPIQRLAPARRNVEPHHRVVRRVSAEAPLVPAAFGHISESGADILGVLRGNHADIRQELDRLAGTCEMGLKLSWRTDNIFEFMVRSCADLRDARDRAFQGRQPTMNEKLQLGSAFEGALNRERARVSALALASLAHVTRDTFDSPPRDEKTICHTALLIDRRRLADFDAALRHTATLLDISVAIDYTGPWPPYSFVRLRLQSGAEPTAA